MDKVKSSVEGTDLLLSDIEKMIPSSTDVDEALIAGAKPIHQKMLQFAPERSSHLKRSINIGKVRSGKNGRNITIGVHRRDFGRGEYYPAYVEYGHGGPKPAPPHPFMRPAYDMSKDEAYTAMKKVIIDQLK